MNITLLRLLRARRGLLRLLRQRPIAGAVLSVLVHALLVTTMVVWRTPFSAPLPRRGEPLIVELPPVAEPPARGAPGDPAPPALAPQPPAPAPRPAPRVAEPPPPPRVAAAPPRAVPEPPRSVPEPPRPAPPAPPPPAPASPPRPEPAAVAPAPPPPAPQAPPVPAPAPPPPPAVVAAPPAPAAPPTAAAPSAPGPAAPSRAPEPAPAGPPPAVSGPAVAALPPWAPPVPPPPDMRSALRRGGAAPGGEGGAGGTGAGRGLIQGEPIPLESKDPRYDWWLEEIRRKIQRNWAYPCVEDLVSGRCEYKSAELVIQFGVEKGGTVRFADVIRQSRWPKYDDYAMNAIKLASPFPPVPDSISKTGVPIVAKFRYVLHDDALTKFLR